MENTYLEQVEKFYNRKLQSHALIELGMTPRILIQHGASDIPLIIKQSTLTKCIRRSTGSRSAHELPRKVIETLPEQIANPIFLITDKERNSIVLISDSEDRKGNKILTAILLNTEQYTNRVNEIKSIYGKTNLKEYIKKHVDKQQLYVVDHKKAEILSRVLGLQLPTALITSSYNKNITFNKENVNQNFKDSVSGKLKHYEKMLKEDKGIAENSHNNILHNQRYQEER